MDQRFCTHCGAQLVSGARFCVECGERADGIARKPARRVAADRLAPAIVVAVVLAVAAGAIFVASRSAAPPAVVPPRESAPAANAAAPLPDGHPPLTVPDDVRQVIERMTELARSKPDDLETWKQLGFVQYRAGQVDRTYLAAAATTYEHVLEIDPKNLDALRALGNIAFDGEKADRAIDYYQRFLAIQPGDTGVLTDLGTMYLSAQQTEKAIETYQTVLKADPKFFQAQFNLAIAYRAAGDSDKALDALKQARGVAEDDATRQRVDDLLARLTGAKPEGAAPAPPAATGVKADFESIFRAHPIVGPKLDRIEWTTEHSLRVVMRDFPMDGMPPEVRKRFRDRIVTGLRDKKAQHQIGEPMQVELVDATSGRVMETVTE